MRPDQAERVAQLFKSAAECSEKERAEFLAQHCGADPDIKAEVESLLKEYDRAGNFMEGAAVDQAAAILDPDASRVGEVIANYEILSLIGSGGMGDVHLARDVKLQREVALKVVRRGMDSADIIRRFHHEERLLAGLNHPNIAQLYGGGITPDGVPYFAMEYVEGRRIDEHCQEKNLTIPERLQLFRKVCAAVHFAHQHLVIHRDVKPSNILVTPESEPKLLDFGIGKLLEGGSSSSFEVTLTIAPIMTPEYASPEHVRGEPVTTASDIYSLGVLLYELLTGQRPYRIKTRRPNEIAKIVCETPPAKPSTAIRESRSEIQDSETRRVTVHHSRALRGDLDNIVLLAMRKEPARRYASAAQFSEDIRRYLEGLPVKARKDTLGYRSSKFIARHRLGVAAAGLILLSLVGGLIATTWQARRVYYESRIAQRRFDEVRQLAHSLIFEIHDSVQNLAGATPTRRLIVARALEYLDRLAHESQNDPTLQRELASAYEKIGDIQGNPYSANLGDTDGALNSYRKALAIRTNFDRSKMDVEAQVELGRTYRGLGDILEQKGDIAGCVKNYRQSLALFQQLAATHVSEFPVQDELARAYETVGDGLARVADGAAERLECYQKALSIRQELLAKQAADRKLRRSVGHSLLKIALTDPKKPEAIAQAQYGTQMLEALAAENRDDARAHREVGFAYYELGGILVAARDYPAALESRRKAFVIRQEIAQEDPKNAQATFDLAVAHADLAEVLTLTGAAPEALQHAKAALKILDQLSATDPGNVVYRRNMALAYEKFAQAYRRLAEDTTSPIPQRLKDWQEARGWYEKASTLFSQLRAEGTLMPSDAKMPEEFAAKLSESDEAIRQLTSALQQPR